MNLCRTRQLSSLLQHSCFCPKPLRQIKSFPLWRTNLNTSTIMSKPIIERTAQFSTSAINCNAVPELSRTERLKQAFKHYGPTLIIFHIGMSLCSLGIWYLIVSSGIDVPALLRKVSIDESKLHIASGASVFVVAYALHKLTAPIRISITLGSAPFIVRYLRRIGILKVKKTADTKKPVGASSEKGTASETTSLTEKHSTSSEKP
uniref:Protein FAM210B n=1 Tax=Cacopsylla melanoneura TaxID=428564 RepID=A0A8D8TQY7_9HEMI